MIDKVINNMILGAGISGLGASYALRQKGEDSLVLEKNDSIGGLCGCFSINGFRFDRFIHLSFSTIDVVNEIFSKVEGGILRHIPNPSNIYKGKWIKHPAQNNLFVLDEDEKKKILDDFRRRPDAANVNVKNYEEWLRLQFGDYFAEHFPMVYTRKYWMKEAHELRTEWAGSRIYQPSLEEVIAGSKAEDERITYYAKEMRYPKYGGYQHFLDVMAKESQITCNTTVKHIDVINKIVVAEDGQSYTYNRLISSLPLTELIPMMDNVPDSVKEATSKLEATCGYHVSIALKGNRIPPYLWWYIYDEDNLASRVYSPSMKSPDNAPQGCSSLQMEVYCKENEYTEQEIIDGTIGKLVELGIINQEDILFTHLGFEKYANVIFTEPIYEARKTVRDYLKSVGIETIGRFGEWDYLWSDQALVSGLRIQ
jgi:protoporphyrinogen oxidase